MTRIAVLPGVRVLGRPLLKVDEVTLGIAVPVQRGAGFVWGVCWLGSSGGVAAVGR